MAMPLLYYGNMLMQYARQQLRKLGKLCCLGGAVTKPVYGYVFVFTISWSLVTYRHLVRGDAAKASPFLFLRTQSKSDDLKQQFPTLRPSLEVHFPAGISVISLGRQPTRNPSTWSPTCDFGSLLHWDFRPG